MKKVHNFTAGPCVLPQQAIDNAIEALKDFKGTGIPVISISHRSKEWDAVMDECRALWREILNIPEDYEILFLGGGASMGFLYVAMNFLENKAGYLETGVWAKKALKEAKGLGNAYAVASSAETVFNYIPNNYEIPADLDYFHITTNNTIYGTEIHEDIDSPVPLIADMSSDILSRPVDVSKYAMIYGGAQTIALPSVSLQIRQVLGVSQSASNHLCVCSGSSSSNSSSSTTGVSSSPHAKNVRANSNTSKSNNVFFITLLIFFSPYY